LYSNDISDDEAYIKNAVYADDGEIIAVAGPPGRWLRKQARKSYLARFLRKMYLRLSYIYKYRDKSQLVVGGLVEREPDLSDISTRFVQTLAEEVEESGAIFVLIVVPSKYRIVNQIFDATTPQFSDKWRQWAENNNIDFIDLVDKFENAALNGDDLFFDMDIHFAPDGHTVTANAIRQKFPDLFPLESSTK